MVHQITWEKFCWKCTYKVVGVCSGQSWSFCDYGDKVLRPQKWENVCIPQNQLLICLSEGRKFKSINIIRIFRSASKAKPRISENSLDSANTLQVLTTQRRKTHYTGVLTLQIKKNNLRLEKCESGLRDAARLANAAISLMLSRFGRRCKSNNIISNWWY